MKIWRIVINRPVGLRPGAFPVVTELVFSVTLRQNSRFSCALMSRPCIENVPALAAAIDCSDAPAHDIEEYQDKQHYE
jgi:hypothetical protein